MADDQYDIKMWNEIKDHADQLTEQYGTLHDEQDEIEDMILMNWDEESEVTDLMENVRVTKSPDARNQAEGAVRLLTAAEPQWEVPIDEESGAITGDVSDKMERMCKAIWDNAGKVRGDPIHYDIVRSGVYWSDIYVGVTSTKDLVEYAKGGSEALQVRAERAAKKTPYLFEVYRPQTCFPEYDQLGLSAFYTEEETDRRTIENTYGEELLADSFGEIGRYDNTTLCDFWDFQYRHVWIKDAKAPFIQEEHKLPFIPRVAQIVEGSMLFTEEDERRQPFLYSLYKSGLWKRLNLMYTVMFTQIMVMGLNAQFIEEQQGDQLTHTEFDIMGGRFVVPAGNKFYPMLDKGIVDPGTKFGLEVADKLLVESTIFKQTLGQPLGGNAPFSMVALLSQSGRLPLVITQRKASWAIAEAMDIALRWMKHEKGTKTVAYEGSEIEMAAEDLPENFTLYANLDISLPQDKLQQSNIARGLCTGEDPMMPKRWGREQLLKEGQSEALQDEIWTEKAADMRFMEYMEEMATRIEQQRHQRMMMQQERMMMEQQAMMGQQQGMGQPGTGQPGMGMPPGQMPPGMQPPMQGPPQGMPPGQSGMPPQNMMPPQQGIPPEMVQGGMQAPMQPPVEGEELPPLPPEELV